MANPFETCWGRQGICIASAISGNAHSFLCHLRSIVTVAHRDHIRRLSVCPCVRLFVWQSHFLGSHALLCFAGDTCISWNAATIFYTFLSSCIFQKPHGKHVTGNTVLVSRNTPALNFYPQNVVTTATKFSVSILHFGYKIRKNEKIHQVDLDIILWNLHVSDILVSL